MLTKQILHQMLKKAPAERMSLSELLQNRDLRARLENPIDGKYMSQAVVTNIHVFLCTGHWSDIYRDDNDTVS